MTFPLTGSLYAGPNASDTTARIEPEAWELLQKDFIKHPPAYIVDLQAKSEFEPVRDYPVLTELLAKQYKPVADTGEALIYEHR